MPEMKTLTVNGTQYEVVDAKARGDFESHASRHASGGADPITPSMIGAVSSLAVLRVELNADDLTDSAALVTVSSTVNPELYAIVGGTFAYILTFFYGSVSTTSRRVQLAFSYNSNPHKMAYRIYAANGWQPWHEIATTENALLKTDKPSGSYTGNGDATARTIDTKGIGTTVLIYSDSEAMFALVGYNGVIHVTNGAITRNYSMSFRNGVITIIGSTSTVMNANGITYNYQVL